MLSERFSFFSVLFLLEVRPLHDCVGIHLIAVKTFEVINIEGLSHSAHIICVIYYYTLTFQAFSILD